MGLCWAFATVPSRIAALGWEYSYEDLRTRITLKFSYEHAIVMQDYQNLLLTANAVFGGKKGNSESSRGIPQAGNTVVAENNDQIVAALQMVGLIQGVAG